MQQHNGTPAALPAGLPRGFASAFVTSGDEKAFYRAELRTLDESVKAAMAKAGDNTTKVYLAGVHDEILDILDPKSTSGATPAAAGAAAGRRRGMDDMDQFTNPTSCFPDYIIRP